jgi:hypothetical protein
LFFSSAFYFDEGDELTVPDDWSNKIVQGKLYNTAEKSGAQLYERYSKNEQTGMR